MIDVNQTRYHLLLGEGDWAPLTLQEAMGSPGEETGLEWFANLECVGLKREVFQFPPRRNDQVSPDDRRGAAADVYGNFYWIGNDYRKIRHLPAAGQVTTYWPLADPGAAACAAESGDFKPVRSEEPAASDLLRSLTVTADHYLVVGVLEPQPGMLVFDLHGGGAPERFNWPVGFHPRLMAARPGGGLLVLDWNRESFPIEPRLWRLDRWFRIEGRTEPATEGEPPAFVDKAQDDAGKCGEIRLPLATSEDALELHDFGMDEPVAVFETGEGLIVVIGADSGLHAFDGEAEPVGEPVDLDALINEQLAEEDRQPFTVHAAAFLREESTLYLVGPDGNQAYALTLEFDPNVGVSATVQIRFLPLRRFSGRALVPSRSAVYYDYEERWLQVVEQPRPRFGRRGSLLAGPFDAGSPDTVWHRLVLDARIPQGCAASVETRVADQLNALGSATWRAQSEAYMRGTGSELPFESSLAGDEERSGTWESLFQHVAGRYLQLRLTLTGSGRTTPKLYALRAYYPRFSYVRGYLPAVYQNDADSASFLERFLANPEGTFTEIEGRIAVVQRLFDVDSCPAEYLGWLAGWLGASFESDWSEARRRLFLRHALELYWQRGTRRGLLRLIRVATDQCLSERIFREDVDDPRNPLNQFGVRLKEGHEMGGSGAPHRFEVSVPIAADSTVEERELLINRVRAVVERERPAHTGCDVKPYWALFQVGSARVGLETQLGESSRLAALIIGAGRLAQGYLGTSYPYNLTNRHVVGAIRPGTRQTGVGGGPCFSC